MSRYGEKGYGGDKYSSGLEKAGGYYHVMVKTRHGRKVRIPRHILSKDCVLFHCQLCSAPPMSAYRDYVSPQFSLPSPACVDALI